MGIPVLPKGDYIFEVGEGKPFEDKRTDEATGEEKVSAGVRYSLEIVEGEDYVGKSIPLSVYVHSEAAYGMTKQFVAACLGYTVKTEGEFNEKYADEEMWLVDPENNVLGDIWKKLQGARVAAAVTKKLNDKSPSGEQNQFRWKPINA